MSDTSGPIRERRVRPPSKRAHGGRSRRRERAPGASRAAGAGGAAAPGARARRASRSVRARRAMCSSACASSVERSATSSFQPAGARSASTRRAVLERRYREDALRHDRAFAQIAVGEHHDVSALGARPRDPPSCARTSSACRSRRSGRTARARGRRAGARTARGSRCAAAAPSARSRSPAESRSRTPACGRARARAAASTASRSAPACAFAASSASSSAIGFQPASSPSAYARCSGP